MTSAGGKGTPGALLDAIREALASSVEGLDVSAVRRETPLGALIFDSLMANTFIAHLEVLLDVRELPFERWLLHHSERAEALTVGFLVDWLASLPELRGPAAGDPDPGGR